MKKAKNVTNWLAKLVFGFALLFGMGSSWALSCSGTIYVANPGGWNSMYLVVDGAFNLLPSTSLSDGWYVINTLDYGSQYADNFFFVASEGGWNDYGITKSVYNETGWDQGDKFTCSDFGTASTLYIYEDPTTAGKTAISTDPPNAKYFYFLPPEDQLWNSSVPMLSTDGGKTGVAMKTDATRCGWFYFVWFNQDAPAEVTIYRDSDTDREEIIGYDGYDGAGIAPTAIPMQQIFTQLNTNTVFFISDAGMWPETMTDAEKGFTITDPSVDGNCEYHLAAIIYDTDASLHPAFSCYSTGAEACQYGAQGISATAAQAAVNACIGVTHGIVQDTLDANKKPLLKTAAMGGVGETCFISQDFFNQMFHPTAGVNEMTCFDLPFNRDAYGKWEFNSDNYTSKGVIAQGGFYPAETTEDANVLTEYGSTPVAAARTQRGAEGPVFVGPLLREVDATEGAQKFDLLCNGAGWEGGIDDCSSRFINGDDDIAAINSWLGTTDACVWGWSCDKSKPAGWPTYKKGTENAGTDAIRWEGTRNQHFCFESHAQFVYKPGLRFNFRGDDDIWVFIGGKLAVDLGGTHLAAPGYAVLDNLTDKNGNKFEEGSTYDLDIFFCDRRTTMSNVRINTNMYIQQSSGVSRSKDTTYTGSGERYHICYEETGSGDCDAALSGTLGSETKVYCDADLANVPGGITVNYALYKGSSVYTAPSGETYDETYFNTAHAAGQTTFFGAVDLSNWYLPVVNKDLVSGLPSGSYKLMVIIGSKKTVVATLRVAGNLDVLSANGKDSTGHVYKVQTSAMADVRIPVFVGAIGEALEDGNLDVDLASAVNESYTVTFSDGLLVYADSNGTTPLTATDKLTVGSKGIDTLWATIPLSAMTATSMKGTISVRKATLELTFQLPAIAFVDSSYTKQLNGYGNWDISEDSILYRGSYYTAYVMMFDPTTGAICNSCNYGLELVATASSEGLTGTSTLGIVEGKGVINFRSSKLYPDVAKGVTDSASFTVATMESALISATWNGLVFTEPPVPIPDTVLVFDTKGKAETYAGLDVAFTSAEYLDGIADSIMVRYHRPFDIDSLPDSILVNWSKAKDEMVVISREEILKAAKVLIPDSLYDSVLTFSGLELSKDVQTANSGSLLSSYATYKKNGIETSSSFDAPFTDKVAPIITRANISEMSEGLFQVKIALSEPVMVSEANAGEVKSLFGYYLRSATDLVGLNKYQVVAATNATVVDSNVTMFYNSSNGTIPQSGDYVRAVPGLLTDQMGNALTDYNATVPSPWMLLEGDAASTIASIKMGTVNKSVDLKADPIVPHFLGIYDSIGVLTEQYPNTLGYIIKTDMGNILTDPTLDSLIAIGKIKLEEVKLKYELDIFTNLGTFVAHKSGSIACSDEFFGGDCRENRGYVYLGWDMVTAKGRIAGTGAYIAKLSTHAYIPTKGKKGKHDVTQTWGVRRTTEK